jgi:hypothetical protein
MVSKAAERTKCATNWNKEGAYVRSVRFLNGVTEVRIELKCPSKSLQRNKEINYR